VTDLVLYRSTGADGGLTAVSGLVSVPDRPAPVGGWPVISWAHGTTGLADACAPSKASLGGQTRIYSSVMDAFLEEYLARGYAVVRTDYEGLGTPGPHPYLMGESEGAAVTDIVLAAHELHPGLLSPDWVAAGHSQGGQGALFATRFSDSYAGSTRLRGVVSLSPPSQMPTVLDMVEREQGEGMESSAFLGPLIYSATTIAGVDPKDVVSDAGLDLLPRLEQECITELSAADSFGGLATTRFLRDGADLTKVRQVIATNDAASLNPKVPVLLVHGAKDELVPALLSDRLSEQYEGRGTDLTYERVPGANHLSVLEDGRAGVDAWLDEHLPAGR
jgi:pimeloyl-ACP methyl ester carboxylesterase